MNRMMRTAGVIAVVLLAQASATTALANDSRSWEFSVLLDGSEIGRHRFELQQAGDRQEVFSEASFDVRFLFFTAFQYRHSNREVWSDGCLRRIESRTRQNGERQVVVGATVDDTFVVERDDGRAELGDCVMTFAYWNPQFLGQTQLLNPQTGQYLPVQIEPLGRREIDIRGEAVDARAWRVTADEIDLTVWYSANDEWLGLESVAKGGRILRYVLT